ncbi:MAG: hypothetical protein J6A40_00660 [Bacteroides sp.]|nr:hypothetical protein [Bacteroides sp.]
MFCNRKFSRYVLLLISLVVYRIIHEYYYKYYISPVYSYAGYVADSSNDQYIYSWIIYILTIFLFTNALFSRDRFWANVSFVLLLLKYVPLIVLLGFIPYENSYIFLNTAFWFEIILFGNLFKPIRIVSNNFIYKNRTSFIKIFYLIIALFIISVLFVSFKYTGFRLHTSLFDVYDIRFEQRENNYPTIFRYILSASTIICPLVLCYFVDKKNYKLSFLFAFIIYVDFSIEGLKAIVFATVIGVLLHYLYKRRYLLYLPLLSSLLLFLISLVKQEEIQKAISFVIWRVFYVPSGMDYEYYTFFNLFEPDFYRNSIFRRFGAESPYSSSSVDIAVGEYFSPEVIGIRANNGLISEGFANFGNWGAFILPFILIIYIKIISSCARGLNESYIFLISVIFAYTIISTFIPATILSSGVWILIIILICYKALN